MHIHGKHAYVYYSALNTNCVNVLTYFLWGYSIKQKWKAENLIPIMKEWPGVMLSSFNYTEDTICIWVKSFWKMAVKFKMMEMCGLLKHTYSLPPCSRSQFYQDLLSPRAVFHLKWLYWSQVCVFIFPERRERKERQTEPEKEQQPPPSP